MSDSEQLWQRPENQEKKSLYNFYIMIEHQQKQILPENYICQMTRLGATLPEGCFYPWVLNLNFLVKAFALVRVL